VKADSFPGSGLPVPTSNERLHGCFLGLRIAMGVRSVLLISRRYGPQPRLPGRSGREHHDPANDYAIGDDIVIVLLKAGRTF
jgi:hypothetical protein